MPVHWLESGAGVLDADSFGYSQGDTLIRSDMDVGPPKTRRRSTKSFDILDVTCRIEYTGFQTFYDFYDISINGGADYFECDNPITGVTELFRFAAPPSYKFLNGGLIMVVSMKWERQP